MTNLQQRMSRLSVTGSWFLIALMFCLSLTVAAAERPGAAEDFMAVRAAVFDYLEGINDVNRERLERAFHPDAELKSIDEEGLLVAQPIGGVIERWMRNAPGNRTGEITAIDINDGTIARVVFDYNGEYIDFLTLAKVQGRWKIIDKVFITR